MSSPNSKKLENEILSGLSVFIQGTLRDYRTREDRESALWDILPLTKK
jgi:hypothetical protein